MVKNGSPPNPGLTKLFLRFAGTGSDSRVLEVGIDSVNLTYSGSVLTVTVPSSAKLYLYGLGSSSATATATLTNAIDQSVFITSGTAFGLNVNSVMTTVLANFSSPFDGVSTRTGTFDVQFIIGSDAVLARFDGTALSTVTRSMTAVSSGSFSITGPSLTGKITVE